MWAIAALQAAQMAQSVKQFKKAEETADEQEVAASKFKLEEAQAREAEAALRKQGVQEQQTKLEENSLGETGEAPISLKKQFMIRAGDAQV